jgi:ubiquinone biosynthesis protein Coq4
MTNRDDNYIEITKLNDLVKLLTNGESYIFYIKMSHDDYKVYSHAEIANADHKYIVFLIRNSKLFYQV